MALDPENPALPTERALVISHGPCVLFYSVLDKPYVPPVQHYLISFLLT